MNCFVLLKNGEIVFCTGQNKKTNLFFAYDLQSIFLRQKNFHTKKIKEVFCSPSDHELGMIVESVHLTDFYYQNNKVNKKLRIIYNGLSNLIFLNNSGPAC